MNHNILHDKINHIREVLPEMNPEEIAALSAALPMERVRVIKSPQTGLIMAQARDCFDTDFYLGEVLVTRAEVAYEGRVGHATLMGDHPAAALIAAVLETLTVEAGAGYIEAAHSICSPVARRKAFRRERESRWVAATRLDFQSMAEEA